MKNYKSKFPAIIIALVILLFVFKDATAQQLITNGSFETTSGLIRYRQSSLVWNQGTFASTWGHIHTPDLFTDNASANDYWFNENGANITCYPEVYAQDNQFGQQNPRTHTLAADGNTWNHNYVMLYTSDEFIYQVLPYALTAGDCYELSFWINRADVSGMAYCAQAVVSTNDLSTVPFPIDIPSDAIYLTTADQPNVGQQGYIVDKVNWTKVTFQFKAQGGERYITIGDFDNSSEKIFFLGSTDCGSSNSCSSTCNAIIGSGNGYYYFYDDVSLVPISGSSFANPVSYSNTTITTNYTGANLLLTGDITITGNCTWSNCQVRCNASTKIFIPTGSSLTINNGTVLKAGCDLMWQGIIVEGSGKIYINSSTIEDALTALTINGTGGWEIGGTATANTYFNKNERDIVINGTSQYTNFIKATVFDHSIPLSNPAQGIGGYGIEGIVINAQTSATAITIGGLNTADICQFKEGQYGIRSKDANVDVKRSFFYGIKQVAIDFQGLNPTHSLRKLTLISSGIINSKRCILSQHKTDLTVQSSSFGGATEHAIEWDDNHDGHLLIGDSLIASLGNTFQNNAWTAVTAWDNKTTCPYNQNVEVATNHSGTADYTAITIGNNHIIAPYAAGGILIGEWTLGTLVPYHSLNVKSNVLDNVVKGVQLYNVKGWIASGIPNNFFNPPPQRVFGNMCNTQTVVVPDAFGIKIANTTGLDIRQNGVASDNAGNYLNRGIVLENSENTDVYGNILNAGTCISVGLDMLNTDLHCNWFVTYAVGVSLGWTYLRAAQNDLHGSVLEQYNNTINAGIPWNSDISVYNSDIYHNQWVWNNAPAFCTITYTGDTGSGTTIISPVQGVDKCLGQFHTPVYNPGTNPQLSFPNDANAQWRADYSYEIRRLNLGIGDASIASSNIKSIIGIENNIGSGHYTDALTELNSFVATNTIEQNYKDVLTIFASINSPLQREPTETEIATLTAIAAHFARTDGAAVTLARAYLAVKYNLDFKDEHFADGEAFGTASITTPCSLEPESKTTLGFIDEYGQDAGITGTTVAPDGSFTFDPFQLAYYSGINRDSTYRIYSIHGSRFTVVNKEYKTLADWIAESPFTLSMSGATVLLDTITDSQTPIDTATMITNADGDLYKVGAGAGYRSSDILLEKWSKGALVWSRLYAGPVETGNDYGTSIALDDNGNVYVA
ncbi:MAG: SBBP repeat-containing protein, partial [Bacteroidia bacterium]